MSRFPPVICSERIAEFAEILVERVEKPTDGRPRSCFVASNATLGDVALLMWSIEIYLKGIDIKLDSLADGHCHNGKLC